MTPLANGQHLDTEFGSLAWLSSAGPNAGLAMFDSTPLGPNDPSQDRDLLVGSGNVLVLQTENFSLDANDVFPRPNDDEDGGTIAFDFPRPPEVLSVEPAGVDAGDGGGRARRLPANGTGIGSWRDLAGGAQATSSVRMPSARACFRG